MTRATSSPVTREGCSGKAPHHSIVEHIASSNHRIIKCRWDGGVLAFFPPFFFFFVGVTTTDLGDQGSPWVALVWLNVVQCSVESRFDWSAGPPPPPPISRRSDLFGADMPCGEDRCIGDADTGPLACSCKACWRPKGDTTAKGERAPPPCPPFPALNCIWGTNEYKLRQDIIS